MCRRNDAVHVASNGAKSGGTEESYKHFPPPEETLSSRVCGSHEEIIATQGAATEGGPYKQRYLPPCNSSFQIFVPVKYDDRIRRVASFDSVFGHDKALPIGGDVVVGDYVVGWTTTIVSNEFRKQKPEVFQQQLVRRSC
jgi:hypothetical protein